MRVEGPVRLDDLARSGGDAPPGAYDLPRGGHARGIQGQRLTMFTFSSRVVYAWPRSSEACTEQPIAESSRVQKTPPCTDPMGLYKCSPTSRPKVTRLAR